MRLAVEVNRKSLCVASHSGSKFVYYFQTPNQNIKLKQATKRPINIDKRGFDTTFMKSYFIFVI